MPVAVRFTGVVTAGMYGGFSGIGGPTRTPTARPTRRSSVTYASVGTITSSGGRTTTATRGR